MKLKTVKNDINRVLQSLSARFSCHSGLKYLVFTSLFAWFVAQNDAVGQLEPLNHEIIEQTFGQYPLQDFITDLGVQDEYDSNPDIQPFVDSQYVLFQSQILQEFATVEPTLALSLFTQRKVDFVNALKQNYPAIINSTDPLKSKPNNHPRGRPGHGVCAGHPGCRCFGKNRGGKGVRVQRERSDSPEQFAQSEVKNR